MKPVLDFSHLTVDQRIQLAQQLWDSVHAQANAMSLTEAQKQELDRRLDAWEAGTMGPGEPWEVVRKRLWE